MGDSGIEILATDPDIEGIPDRQTARFVERRNYIEFALFWPVGLSSLHEEAVRWKQPGKGGQTSAQARWVCACLDTRSGRVQPSLRKIKKTRKTGLRVIYSRLKLEMANRENHSLRFPLFVLAAVPIIHAANTENHLYVVLERVSLK